MTYHHILIDAEAASQVRARVDAFRAWLGDRRSYRPEDVPQGMEDATNEMKSALERFEFMRDKPERYFAYARLSAAKTTGERNALPRVGDALDVTTWTGQLLLTGRVNRVWFDNFGGRRVSFHARPADGSDVRYSGVYFYSAGDYARLRKLKA